MGIEGISARSYYQALQHFFSHLIGNLTAETVALQKIPSMPYSVGVMESY